MRIDVNGLFSVVLVDKEGGNLPTEVASAAPAGAEHAADTEFLGDGRGLGVSVGLVDRCVG